MPIELDEFSFELDLREDLKGVPRKERASLKKEIGKLVKQEIDANTRKQRSPVDGSRYKSLSKDYKKKKIKEGKGGKADLHLNNKMIKAIKDRNTKNGVKFEITNKKIIPRAYNHNTGDTLPQRQLMPDEDLNEEFKPSIMKKVDQLIAKKRDPKLTKRLELLRLSRKELSEAATKALGNIGAQRILREGFDPDEIVDAIMES